MSAKKFLQLLDESGLIDETVMAEIRGQVSSKRSSAEAIAKALVDRGYLTRFQATNLVTEATAESGETTPAEAEPAAPAAAANDDLGLAPLDDDEEDESAAAGSDDVVMLEDAGDALTPVEDAGASLTPVDAPNSGPAAQPRQLAGGLQAVDDSSFDPFAEEASQPTITLPKATRRLGSKWETKLMFGGVLALLLFVLFFVILYVSLSTAPAIEMWEAAMEDYRSESYSQAQAKFEEFLEDYPEDEHASEARVRIALAKIHTVLGDPQKGLERANELLPTIEPESAFSVARDELAKLLIRIPQGFVQRAKNASGITQKEELVARAEAGMELVDNPSYVPSSRRSSIQNDIRRTIEDINLVHRDINQDKDLAKAIDEIRAAAGSASPVAGYEIFKALHKKYPGLSRNSNLLEAVQQITERERELVTVTEEPLAASSDDVPRSSEYRVVLASRSGDGASRMESQVAAFLASGSVYGLDAGSGTVLWSRFVGHGTTSPPVPISVQRGADLLIVDSQRHELLRLKPQNGQVVWRLPVGEPFSEPVSSGRSIYVSTASGKLREIDPETGTSPRYVQIPQPLGVSPALAPNRPLLIQAGLHSNLYLVSTDTLQCEAVHYLGHREGAIAVPPLAHLGHAFVAENAGGDLSLLNVLAVKSEDSGVVVESVQNPLRLSGNVVVPLQLFGRRVLVVTDRGALEVLDVDMNKAEPASKAASLSPTLESRMHSYPLTDGRSLWIADDRLTQYRVQVTTKTINRQEITNMGDSFIAPPQLFGDILIYAARPRDSVGIEVAAVHVDAPRKKLWSTHLGVPAGRVTVDETTKAIHVISAAASLFRIDRDALQNGYNNQPEVTARTGSGATSFTEQIELPGGPVAFYNPAQPRELLVYRPEATSRRLQVLTVELPEGEPTAVPVAFRGGILYPLSNGDVALVNIETGEPQLLPFRPRLEPGETIRWLRPTVIGPERDEFVLANDLGTLYRVGVKTAPQEHLAQSATNRLDVKLDSPLAVAGDTVYGVVRSSGTDVLVAIDAAKLEMTDEIDLQGRRVTWGPERVGDRVLIVTDNNQIHCFGPGRQSCWETPAPAFGKPAGLPLIDGEDYIFAAHDGTVWRIAGATGKQLQKADIGEPLGSGPVAFGSRLLLCGHDGAVHVLAMPAGS